MRIEPLLSFCSVVEQGSFHKAAAAIYLSQPAVSMNIKQLEKEYGQLLLTRTKRGKLTLTPFGEQLYEIAQGLREQVKQLEMLKKEWSRQNSDEIIIDCIVPAGMYLLTTFISKFQENYPNVHISINHLTYDIAIKNILEGNSDLVMLLSPPYNPKLQYVALWEDDLKIVVPFKHPLNHLNEKDLLNQTFILPPKGLPTRTIIDEIFKKTYGTTINCMTEIASPEVLRQSVMSLYKPGIALGSMIKNDIEHHRLKVVPTELKMNCQHILFYKKNRFLSKSIRELIDLITQKMD